MQLHTVAVAHDIVTVVKWTLHVVRLSGTWNCPLNFTILRGNRYSQWHLDTPVKFSINH